MTAIVCVCAILWNKRMHPFGKNKSLACSLKHGHGPHLSRNGTNDIGKITWCSILLSWVPPACWMQACVFTRESSSFCMRRSRSRGDKCEDVRVYPSKRVTEQASVFLCVCVCVCAHWQLNKRCMTSCWQFHIHSGAGVRLYWGEKKKKKKIGGIKINGRWVEKHIMASPRRVTSTADLLLSCLHRCVCVCACVRLLPFILYPFSLSFPHFLSFSDYTPFLGCCAHKTLTKHKVSRSCVCLCVCIWANVPEYVCVCSIH